jgi:hypothetical protein
MEVFGNFVYYIIVVSLVFPVDWLLKAVRKKYNDKSYEVSFYILAIVDRVVFILAMIALMGTLNFFTNEPEAIDVYRGKTELYIEQTMRGNKVIKSDTTVVFKQEKSIK